MVKCGKNIHKPALKKLKIPIVNHAQGRYLYIFKTESIKISNADPNNSSIACHVLSWTRAADKPPTAIQHKGHFGIRQAASANRPGPASSDQEANLRAAGSCS
jgi:hypothetical protein